MDSSPPSVSIVLLTKNHRHYLEETFPLLETQDYTGSVEVLCVDSGSEDGTIEFLRGHGVDVREIPPEEFHHARTRNFASGFARNDVLVFLSADAIPANTQWLRKLVTPFEDPRVWGVYGKQLPQEHIGAVRQYAMQYLYHDTREERDLAAAPQMSLALFRFSDANSAVARHFWESHPFNETVTVAEDHGMCYAILTNGGKVVYEPEAAVIHAHERSLWEEFKCAFDNGISLKRMGILGNPELGSEMKYGLHRIVEEFRHFTGRRMYGAALQSFAISVVKFLGVQVGKRGDRLPWWLVHRLSPRLPRL